MYSVFVSEESKWKTWNPKGSKTPGETLPTIEEIKATLEEF